MNKSDATRIIEQRVLLCQNPCSCPMVVYEHPMDGECTHPACEGDRTATGCGEIIAVGEEVVA